VTVNNVVTTRSPSAIGLLMGIVVALSATALAIYLSFRHLTPPLTHLIPLVVFISIFSLFAWAFHVRRFVFDGESRTFTVEDRWLIVLRGKTATYKFADIRYIGVDTGGEGSGPAYIELGSGKKLYFGPGTRKGCRQVAELTGYGGDPFK
jgi:hypothetical protein